MTTRTLRPRESQLEAQEDRYLALRQLAAYCGLSVRTLRSQLSSPSNPLPHYRLAGKILVRRSEFDAWMLAFRQAEPTRVDTIVDDVLKGL